MRILALALIGIGVLGACSRPASAPPGTAAASATPGTGAAKPKVARVVFVGKQNACDCTRKAIDASWKALEAALGSANRIPVERLQEDTQRPQVAAYRGRRAFVALPAIYLLDEGDSVIEMLQGEVTEAQLRPHLAYAKPVSKRP